MDNFVLQNEGIVGGAATLNELCIKYRKLESEGGSITYEIIVSGDEIKNVNIATLFDSVFPGVSRAAVQAVFKFECVLRGLATGDGWGSDAKVDIFWDDHIGAGVVLEVGPWFINERWD